MLYLPIVYTYAVVTFTYIIIIIVILCKCVDCMHVYIIYSPAMDNAYFMLVYTMRERKLVNIGLVNGCTWSLEVDMPVHDFGIHTHTIWGPSNYYYANVITNITCTLYVSQNHG